MPTLAQFEPLCRRPLRRPLYDPPPKAKPAPVVVAQKPPPLNVRLVGTALEPDHSMAMLLTSRGTIEMKAVGDKLDDTPDSAELTSIEQDRVTLRYHGQTVRLEVENKDGR
jgi:type II secretory pathway component PulC